MSRVVGILWQILGRTLDARGLGVLAESCFRKAIETAPASGASSCLRLGRMLIGQRRYADALVVLKAGVSMHVGSAEIWNVLGVACRETGDLEGARQAFNRALALNPSLTHAQNNLGNWLLANGDPQAALIWFEKAITSGGSYEALNNRVAALLDMGRSAEAEEAATLALNRFPESAPLHLNLGNSYLQRGKGRLALQSYTRALELEPGFEEAHFNCALLKGASEHLGNAINFLEKEIERRGRSVDLLNRLAVGYMARGAFHETERLSLEVLDMQPDFVPAYISLGNAISWKGDARSAKGFYEKAVNLRPDDCYVRSNLLFELNYLPTLSAEEILRQHLEWARRHEAPFAGQRLLLQNEKNPERKIRIGYVSPDFVSHPVGYLTKGVLGQHDHNQFEIHCYSHVTQEDEVTGEIRKSANFWHDTSGVTDAELAKTIEEDRIDILIDLSGHTGNHRLPLFARKPAPIQATWIGYFHSTGLESIDYFITDPHTSPKGSDQLFSETPLHLPHTRFCYAPPPYLPPIESSPCLKKGYITFGCFNKLAKISDEVVSVWAQILTRVPGSRLRLKSAALSETTVCEQMQSRFAAHGIAIDRLELKPASSHVNMLKEYGEIDIALDPYPYNGGMTTFEALIMGVPVIALAGKSVVARQSASALSNLGLQELAHESIPQYIACAAQLASDPLRLDELRQSIRPTMLASPLCDHRQLAKDLEILYRRMWQAWCSGQKLPSDI